MTTPQEEKKKKASALAVFSNKLLMTGLAAFLVTFVYGRYIHDWGHVAKDILQNGKGIQQRSIGPVQQTIKVVPMVAGVDHKTDCQMYNLQFNWQFGNGKKTRSTGTTIEGVRVCL